MSGSTRHYDCGLLELAGQARWNAMFTRRRQPGWFDDLLDVLAKAGRGTLPPSLESRLFDRVA